jgi:hypothetical protein
VCVLLLLSALLLSAVLLSAACALVCSVTWQPPAAPKAGVSVLLQTQGEGVLACQARACARVRVAPLPCAAAVLLLSCALAGCDRCPWRCSVVVHAAAEGASARGCNVVLACNGGCVGVCRIAGVTPHL